MAETNVSSQQPQTHHPNPALQSLLHCLDPISLILSQHPDSDQPVRLRLTTESFIMERGPRYRAYAELRESRLRMKNATPQREEEGPELIRVPTPPKKQVKFQSTNVETKRKASSSSFALAQSVPDFSSVLRKENRKPPPPTMTTAFEMTPPSKSLSKAKSMSNSRGSKSANAGEKRGLAAAGAGAARKSYASMEELKGFSLAAANAINGESRGGGARRTVLGYRPF